MRKLTVGKRQIHDNIRRLRHARGFSQYDLARLLEVDQATISYWESGRAAPNWRREPFVARVLGVTVKQLRGESAA